MSDKFTDAYIECALWSSTDDAGNFLDVSDAELSPEARTRLETDAKAFQAKHADLLAQVPVSEYGAAAQSGHDFWLTRNGHGAGFWDRGYEKALGDALTAAAKAEGPCDLYIDDGKIYVM